MKMKKKYIRFSPVNRKFEGCVWVDLTRVRTYIEDKAEGVEHTICSYDVTGRDAFCVKGHIGNDIDEANGGIGPTPGTASEPRQEGKKVYGLRPALAAFALFMETRLRSKDEVNAHGWSKADPKSLVVNGLHHLNRADSGLSKSSLGTTTLQREQERIAIKKELLDAANYCMMAWDVLDAT